VTDHRFENIADHACLSVAPMMDWTDRHCRYLHRLMSRRALLYTEMVTSPALVRGQARHLLRFDPAEHPVALQLGGSDPDELAEAAIMGAQEGYEEINLNCGCPSDRVQSGSFGAILMETPDLVARCCAAMKAAQSAEVTVKCRIGVDDQDPENVLPDFLARVADGITSLEQARAFLDAGLDGVMIGRAAYHTPTDILQRADAVIWGEADGPDPIDVVLQMRSYIDAHLCDPDWGGRRAPRLSQVTKHMLGLFAGQPGARQWRRYLSDHAHRDGAGWSVIEDALAARDQAAA